MAELANTQPEVQQKKRKRTGKEREERKRAAIQARLEAEAAAAAEGGEVAKDEAEAPIPENEVVAEAATPTVDFEMLAKRIPAGLKKLHPVFKQAKKAETMRLIKKIRFLKSKSSDEVGELEAQLNLLSAVQLHALATTHLRQKLKKHHTLKHVDLPENITAVLPVNPSVPASSSSATPEVIAKVENRLCSSKQVADAIKPVIAWVLSEPGASLKVGVKKDVKPKIQRARQEADSSDEEDDEESDAEVGGPVQGLESDDEAVMEDKAADAAGWESGSLGGDESGDDAGWESGSDGGFNIAPDSESEDNAPRAKKLKNALSKPAPPPKKSSKKDKDDGSSSMFLPSLAAGFTPGDGDSDPDMDYDEDGIIGSKTAIRKNRRGQRARQAIWEKKYGKGAKHVIKAKEEAEKKMRGPQGQKRDQGWGKPRDGEDAPAAASAAPAFKASLAKPVAAGRPTGRPSAPAPKAPKSDPSLHPSWEAARLRKQREMDGAGAAKATKIVFD